MSEKYVCPFDPNNLTSDIYRNGMNKMGYVDHERFADAFRNMSESDQLCFLRVNGNLIRYLENPTETQQTESLKQSNGYSLKHIKNPSAEMKKLSKTLNSEHCNKMEYKSYIEQKLFNGKPPAKLLGAHK